MTNAIEVAEHSEFKGQWHAERVLSDGSVEVAMFTGPNAEARATQFAASGGACR